MSQQGQHHDKLLALGGQHDVLPGSGATSLYQNEEHKSSTLTDSIVHDNLPQKMPSYNLDNYDNGDNNDSKSDNRGDSYDYVKGKILTDSNATFSKQAWNAFTVHAPKGDALSIIACNAGVVAITDGVNKVPIKEKDFLTATRNALKKLINYQKYNVV